MTAPAAGMAALAARARSLAGTAPPRPMDRKARGCAAVVLGTCRTIRAARQALDDVPPDVRAAALARLGELAGEGLAP